MFSIKMRDGKRILKKFYFAKRKKCLFTGGIDNEQMLRFANVRREIFYPCDDP